MAEKETPRTRLTRADMEKIVNEGGSVMHDGEVIKSVDDLPDDATLAQGDEQREAQVSAAIDDQIAALTAQKSRLGAARKSAPVPAAGDEAKAGTEATPTTHEAVGPEAERPDAQRGLFQAPKAAPKK